MQQRRKGELKQSIAIPSAQWSRGRLGSDCMFPVSSATLALIRATRDSMAITGQHLGPAMNISEDLLSSLLSSPSSVLS